MLRVAIITSNPRGNSARIAEYLADSLANAKLVLGVVDTGTAHDRRRQLRRLQVWRKAGGVGYVAWRLGLELAARRKKGGMAEHDRSLAELGRDRGFPVIDVPNVNSQTTRGALLEHRCQLGVSIGNRIIRPEIFSVPDHGMINLHHGRIPEYRGGPPAFWELYNGESEMGVSVHRIDAALDHGAVLAQGSIPIRPGDDPTTLMERAYEIDADLVRKAIEAIARGDADLTNRTQSSDSRVHTIPSRREVKLLSERLGRPVRHDDFRRARFPDPR